MMKVDQVIKVQHPNNPLLNVKLLCVAVHDGPRSVIDRYLSIDPFFLHLIASRVYQGEATSCVRNLDMCFWLCVCVDNSVLAALRSSEAGPVDSQLLYGLTSALWISEADQIRAEVVNVLKLWAHSTDPQIIRLYETFGARGSNIQEATARFAIPNTPWHSWEIAALMVVLPINIHMVDLHNLNVQDFASAVQALLKTSNGFSKILDAKHRSTIWARTSTSTLFL